VRFAAKVWDGGGMQKYCKTVVSEVLKAQIKLFYVLSWLFNGVWDV
jgi:hypothetical protein